MMKKVIIIFAAAILTAACGSSDTVSAPIPIQASIDGANQNRCLAGNVILAAFSQRADSYEWYRDGEVIPGQNSVFLDVTESGTYTVAGINEEGKGLVSKPHRVDIIPCDITLSGEQTNVCPEEKVKLVAEAYDASSFEWKKDGIVIEGETASVFYASESGSYTVAPVYRDNVGQESEAREVSLVQCRFIDVLVGKWDVDEYWIWTNDFYNGDHTVTIEKVDDTNIRILDFTGENIQEQIVTATVDNDNRTITIPWQPIITDGSTLADIYLAGIVVSSAAIHSIGVGIGTLPVVGKGRGMTITFPGTVYITPPKQELSYLGTWQTIAFYPGTEPVAENLLGTDMVGMETVWTKK
jgi:hypothetical protein